ncbi:recombinase [Phaeobacter sp. PT47_59]|uniref:recombinase n=1 Tax=Phaeobacter sp. PT47_59 TaxID=3029979 RepID=UPI00238024F9|nr:recombinase [Phaeobacter sp. PT47_59]MDE4172650.1 recombinase [Phaeobacter sp. PT47_59]
MSVAAFSFSHPDRDPYEARHSMTHHSADDRARHSLDLLRSLQESMLRLRNHAEYLRHELEENGPEVLEGRDKQQVAKLDSLIRDCQKVEKTLAEQTQSATADDTGLDLERARAEITRRLDRLRAAGHTTEPAGQPE